MNKILFTALLFSFFQALSQSDSTVAKNDSLYSLYSIPMFNNGSHENESELEQQDVSSLLQSSRDVYTQFSAMQFGPLLYRMRGSSAKNTQVSVNGIVVNSPDNGMAAWSSWGGLNDATAFPEVRINIAASRYGFCGIGGYVNMESRAASFKKSTRLTFSNANTTYRFRAMLTRHTGLLKNNWAFSFSMSSRNGKNIYFPGTYFHGQSFYASADKKINKHLLGLSVFYAPLQQGRSSALTLETYQLAGSHYYNKNWGYQQGKLRSAAENATSRPMFILSDVYSPKEYIRINTSLYSITGKTKTSGIITNNAPNPDPAYYRNLPSYYYQKGDSLNGDRYLLQWEDESFRQINWDRLIAMNQANLYTDPHLLGQGSNQTETRARYCVADWVRDLRQLGINSVLNYRRGRDFISAGVDATHYSNREFYEMKDLLGATYWLDVDQFAEDLGVEETLMQNNLDNPNRKIKTGDRFGYDHSIEIRKAGAWVQLEHGGEKLDAFIGTNLNTSSTWRHGYVANGKFPGSSKGQSEKIQLITGGIKTGLIYKLNGRHYLVANAQAASRNPESSAMFISPRIRNDLRTGIKPEQLFSTDLSYHLKYPDLKLRASLYYTQLRNQAWIRSYWHDTYNTTVNLIMKNVEQEFTGFELGIEKIIKVSHQLQFAAGYGVFRYMNRPLLEAWQDNNNTALFTDRKVYLKNYRIGAAPGLAAGMGYKFTHRRYWYAGAYVNYIAERYVEPNPDRRTAEAIGRYQENEKHLTKVILEQEKLPDAFLVNANAGKSWRLRKKYMINASLSVNNLLNNRNILRNGVESLRWDQSNISKFPNKYNYLPGISYMLNLSCSF